MASRLKELAKIHIGEKELFDSKDAYRDFLHLRNRQAVVGRS